MLKRGEGCRCFCRLFQRSFGLKGFEEVLGEVWKQGLEGLLLLKGIDEAFR